MSSAGNRPNPRAPPNSLLWLPGMRWGMAEEEDGQDKLSANSLQAVGRPLPGRTLFAEGWPEPCLPSVFSLPSSVFRSPSSEALLLRPIAPARRPALLRKDLQAMTASSIEYSRLRALGCGLGQRRIYGASQSNLLPPTPHTHSLSIAVRRPPCVLLCPRPRQVHGASRESPLIR